ncbi:MAG TPA: NCS2 family permease [Thermodesulfobacteriota bacterium]|nr:NCS2 family permease [Thermodesulfobacteriota bacterium]
MLESLFELRKRGTTVGTEVLAGATTFMVMAYIIFVNPNILVGLPREQTAAATALAAGVMSIAMGLYANMPIALASGMGLNAVVAFTLVKTLGLTYEQAMAVIFWEGIVITLLVLTRFRMAVFRAIPLPLKRAIGVGIGLFIALIGASQAGLVKPGFPEAPIVANLELGQPATVVSLIGLVITGVLLVAGLRGAILLGILLTTLVGALFGVTAPPRALVALPDFSALGRIDFAVIANLALWPAIFAIMLSDFFDTMGTMVSVAGEAGLLDAKGEVPKGNRVLLVDSLAAAVGGLFRASSVTSYIESAAGVAAGGRTGLTAVVTGLLFLACIFAAPLVSVVPPAATAPALIVVGFYMMTVVRDIPWSDPIEALPAFVTMLFIPITFNITRGIGYGFILYTVLMVLAGRAREVHPLMYVVSAAFAVSFSLVRLI